jgi:DNA-binding beta-propeller fold protein YncE
MTGLLSRAVAHAPAAPTLALSTGRIFGVAWGGGYLWANAADDGDVLRIDPATRTITRVHVGGFPIRIAPPGHTANASAAYAIAPAGAAIWATSPRTHTVSRIQAHP